MIRLRSRRLRINRLSHLYSKVKFRMALSHLSSDHITKAFGVRVRALRQKNTNLSQEELAVRAGFHRTFISRVERGETNITLVNLLRICDALGVTVSEFFAEFEANIPLTD